MAWTVRLADALVSLGEGFLWIYLGPRLLGFRPGGRLYFRAALLAGVLIILVSEANRHLDLPLGVHNLVILAGVVALCRGLLGMHLGAAAAGTLATFLAGLVGTLVLIGVTIALRVNLARLLEDPLLYLLGAVLEHGFQLLLALAVWRLRLVLFDATIPTPGLKGTLALLTAFLAQSYVLLFMGVISASTRTPLWAVLPWGLPPWGAWLLATAFPVVAVFLVRQFDRLHRAELEALENRRLAEFGRLSSQLAHEVRNPVTAIKGWLQMGERYVRSGGQVPPQVADAFVVGARQVEHLEQLLTDFLVLGRMGGRPEAPAPTDLARVVREAVEGLRELAASRQVTLEVEAPPAVPPLEAVPQRLRQCLDNLVKNAIEASEGGGLVRVVLAQATDGEHLLVEVVDTGRGMPPELLSEIFQPFFTTKEEGTGLGLTVVRQVVADLGGTVEVESEPGRGSRFTVRLPLHPPARGPAPRPAPP